MFIGQIYANVVETDLTIVCWIYFELKILKEVESDKTRQNHILCLVIDVKHFDDKCVIVSVFNLREIICDLAHDANRYYFKKSSSEFGRLSIRVLNHLQGEIMLKPNIWV